MDSDTCNIPPHHFPQPPCYPRPSCFPPRPGVSVSQNLRLHALAASAVSGATRPHVRPHGSGSCDPSKPADGESPGSSGGGNDKGAAASATDAASPDSALTPRLQGILSGAYPALSPEAGGASPLSGRAPLPYTPSQSGGPMGSWGSFFMSPGCQNSPSPQSFAHLKAALTSPSWPSPKFNVRKPEGYVPITPASLLSSPHHFRYGTPGWISGGCNSSPHPQSYTPSHSTFEARGYAASPSVRSSIRSSGAGPCGQAAAAAAVTPETSRSNSGASPPCSSRVFTGGLGGDITPRESRVSPLPSISAAVTGRPGSSGGTAASGGSPIGRTPREGRPGSATAAFEGDISSRMSVAVSPGLSRFSNQPSPQPRTRQGEQQWHVQQQLHPQSIASRAAAVIAACPGTLSQVDSAAMNDPSTRSVLERSGSGGSSDGRSCRTIATAEETPGREEEQEEEQGGLFMASLLPAAQPPLISGDALPLPSHSIALSAAAPPTTQPPSSRFTGRRNVPRLAMLAASADGPATTPARSAPMVTCSLDFPARPVPMVTSCSFDPESTGKGSPSSSSPSASGNTPLAARMAPLMQRQQQRWRQRQFSTKLKVQQQQPEQQFDGNQQQQAQAALHAPRPPADGQWGRSSKAETGLGATGEARAPLSPPPPPHSLLDLLGGALNDGPPVGLHLEARPAGEVDNTVVRSILAGKLVKVSASAPDPRAEAEPSDGGAPLPFTGSYITSGAEEEAWCGSSPRCISSLSHTFSFGSPPTSACSAIGGGGGRSAGGGGRGGAAPSFSGTACFGRWRQQGPQDPSEEAGSQAAGDSRQEVYSSASAASLTFRRRGGEASPSSAACLGDGPDSGAKRGRPSGGSPGECLLNANSILLRGLVEEAAEGDDGGVPMESRLMTMEAEQHRLPLPQQQRLLDLLDSHTHLEAVQSTSAASRRQRFASHIIAGRSSQQLHPPHLLPLYSSAPLSRKLLCSSQPLVVTGSGQMPHPVASLWGSGPLPSPATSRWGGGMSATGAAAATAPLDGGRQQGGASGGKNSDAWPAPGRSRLFVVGGCGGGSASVAASPAVVVSAAGAPPSASALQTSGTPDGLATAQPGSSSQATCKYRPLHRLLATSTLRPGEGAAATPTGSSRQQGQPESHAAAAFVALPNPPPLRLESSGAAPPRIASHLGPGRERRVPVQELQLGDSSGGAKVKGLLPGGEVKVKGLLLMGGADVVGVKVQLSPLPAKVLAASPKRSADQKATEGWVAEGIHGSGSLEGGGGTLLTGSCGGGGDALMRASARRSLWESFEGSALRPAGGRR